jgi:hypothetical protein
MQKWGDTADQSLDNGVIHMVEPANGMYWLSSVVLARSDLVPSSLASKNTLLSSS